LELNAEVLERFDLLEADLQRGYGGVETQFVRQGSFGYRLSRLPPGRADAKRQKGSYRGQNSIHGISLLQPLLRLDHLYIVNPMDQNQLIGQVIDVIVDAVNLHHLDRSTMGPETLLANGGLGLDSVDILEIVVAIEHKFGVKAADAETGKLHFQTIGTIARFIQSKSGNA
jgi:acyl carrier protein